MTIAMNFAGMPAMTRKSRRAEQVSSVVHTRAACERAERIARLKMEIDNGTYFVPAAQVAGSIMRVMLKR